MCVRMQVCECHGESVDVRGQLPGVGSLSPPCGVTFRWAVLYTSAFYLLSHPSVPTRGFEWLVVVDVFSKVPQDNWP